MAVFTGLGSAASPSITFSADTNTGIFSPGADILAFTRGGVEAARIDSSGRLLVGTSTSLGGLDTLQVNSTSPANLVGLYRQVADVAGPRVTLSKSRGTPTTAVLNNDLLGTVQFNGSDGTDMNSIGASIDAAVDGTPGTNDMPGRLVFSTTADGSASPTERMRIDNQGRVGFNATVLDGPSGAYRFAGNIGGAVTSQGIVYTPSIQSDATTAANLFVGQSATASNGGTPYTITTLRGFLCTQGTFNADSTVTNQYGFEASSVLTGATNNYGFVGNLASATGRWNFYGAGTAPNWFAGDVRTNTAFTARTAPANSNVSATATASSLLDGLRTGTPTGNINLTLPTGTGIDSAFQDLQNNQAFEWSVINLAASSHVITVVAASGHTVVGNMAVAAATSGRFITRKTAANTFISYRIG